jgi:hypothetical protein
VRVKANMHHTMLLRHHAAYITSFVCACLLAFLLERCCVYTVDIYKSALMPPYKVVHAAHIHTHNWPH